MEYRFCPLCGSALTSTIKLNSKRIRQACLKCEFINYENPKPCVGAVIVKNSKILLTRRAYEPFKDYWDFPGGFLEKDEHPKEGLKREVEEELQIDIKIVRQLGIYMDHYGPKGDSTLNIYYLCKILSGEINPQVEIAEAKWFGLSAPPANLAFGHVKLVFKTVGI